MRGEGGRIGGGVFGGNGDGTGAVGAKPKPRRAKKRVSWKPDSQLERIKCYIKGADWATQGQPNLFNKDAVIIHAGRGEGEGGVGGVGGGVGGPGAADRERENLKSNFKQKERESHMREGHLSREAQLLVEQAKQKALEEEAEEKRKKEAEAQRKREALAVHRRNMAHMTRDRGMSDDAFRRCPDIVEDTRGCYYTKEPDGKVGRDGLPTMKSVKHTLAERMNTLDRCYATKNVRRRKRGEYLYGKGTLSQEKQVQADRIEKPSKELREWRERNKVRPTQAHTHNHTASDTPAHPSLPPSLSLSLQDRDTWPTPKEPTKETRNAIARLANDTSLMANLQAIMQPSMQIAGAGAGAGAGQAQGRPHTLTPHATSAVAVATSAAGGMGGMGVGGYGQRMMQGGMPLPAMQGGRQPGLAVGAGLVGGGGGVGGVGGMGGMGGGAVSAVSGQMQRMVPQQQMSIPTSGGYGQQHASMQASRQPMQVPNFGMHTQARTIHGGNTAVSSAMPHSPMARQHPPSHAQQQQQRAPIGSYGAPANPYASASGIPMQTGGGQMHGGGTTMSMTPEQVSQALALNTSLNTHRQYPQQRKGGGLGVGGVQAMAAPLHAQAGAGVPMGSQGLAYGVVGGGGGGGGGGMTAQQQQQRALMQMGGSMGQGQQVSMYKSADGTYHRVYPNGTQQQRYPQ